MNCYIISFETSLTDKTRLEELIKSYSTWAKINSNTWAVVTDKSSVEIRDRLFPVLADGDRLFVIRSGKEAAWRNSAASNDWLRNNL